MKMRKIPMRRCIGCGEMKPKKELTRVVRTLEQTIVLDPTGKRAGRGAYLCANPTCFQVAKKSRALDRAFKQAVDPEVYDELALGVADRTVH